MVVVFCPGISENGGILSPKNLWHSITRTFRVCIIVVNEVNHYLRHLRQKKPTNAISNHTHILTIATAAGSPYIHLTGNWLNHISQLTTIWMDVTSLLPTSFVCDVQPWNKLLVFSQTDNSSIPASINKHSLWTIIQTSKCYPSRFFFP